MRTRSVYTAAWCPTEADVLITASGDCTCKVFDVRQPVSSMTIKPHDFEVKSTGWGSGPVACSPGAVHCKRVLSDPSAGPGGRLEQVRREHRCHGVGRQDHPDVGPPAPPVPALRLRCARLRRPEARVLAVQASGMRWQGKRRAHQLSGPAVVLLWLRPIVGVSTSRPPFHLRSAGLLAACSYDMSVTLWDIGKPGTPPLQRWGHHTEFAVGLDFSALVDGLIASSGWDGLTYVWNVQAQPGVLPPLPQR